MRNLRLVAVALASVALVACGDASTSSGSQRRPQVSLLSDGLTDNQATVGENDDDSGNPNANTPPKPPPAAGVSTEIAVTLSSAIPAADLGGEIELTVTVAPKGTFKGDADLTVSGVPAGATATFTPAKVTLNTSPVTAKLLLRVPVTAVPSAPGKSSALVVSAKSGTASATANANFKINPKLKLVIPVNVDALRATGTTFVDQWGTAFGATPTPLKTQIGNGIVVTVFNADSKMHIVHGANGFAHGSTNAGEEVKPNAFELVNNVPRERTLNPGANVNGYPHEGANGAGASFQIQVQAAP